MKKKGALLILLVLAVSAALFAASALQKRNRTADGTVNVYVDGALYASSALGDGKTIVIDQENGSKNVIRLTDDGFYMEEASCPDQRCVHQGTVTQSNWQKRSLGTQVICLPNRVVAELVLRGTTNSDQNIDVPDV